MCSEGPSTSKEALAAHTGLKGLEGKEGFSGTGGGARRPLMWTWLGGISYAEALVLQRSLWQGRYRGKIPDWLLLLEHVPPVVTFGRDGGAENLKVSPDVLKGKGIEVYEAERGGNVTYHGPGQVVGYTIMDLREHGRDILKFLRAVEESLISVLGRLGVEGYVEPEHPGVWVDVEGRPLKIAAVGISIRHWVTMHGFSLNVTTAPETFDLIIPCGIPDRGVISVAALLGGNTSSLAVSSSVSPAAAFSLSGTMPSSVSHPFNLEALSALIAEEFAEHLSLTPRKTRLEEVRWWLEGDKGLAASGDERRCLGVGVPDSGDQTPEAFFEE